MTSYKRLSIQRALASAIVCVLLSGAVHAQIMMMELPRYVREWYFNRDGSCVQCSLGMVGLWNNVPAASTLLWDTPYGPAERGGSWPSRVSEYSQRRGIKIYNITGSPTFDWMIWAAKTNRYAAIGAGRAHFQTLYGRDFAKRLWYVCNNNSPWKIDEYTDEQFRNLHLASGRWIVVIDGPAIPMVPEYVQWWGEHESLR